MSNRASTFVAFMFVLTASGCSSVSVLVTAEAPRKAPMIGSPFRIVWGPPPVRAAYIGTVLFQTEAMEVVEAFNTVREKVRRVGGNFVANLKCQGMVTYIVPTRGGIPVGSAQLAGTKAHCRGKIYYVPYHR